MKLQQLYYFLKISQYQNISRAAEELHISQPSLSRAVKELEEEFQISLFRRASKGLILTEEGNIFAKEAELLLAHAKQFEEDMHHLSQDVTPVRIGVSPMIAQSVFPKFLQYCRERDPHLQFEMIENGTNTNLRLVREGKLDLALVSHIDPLPDTFLAQELTSTSIRFFANRNHPAAGRSGIRLPEIAKENLVLLKEDSFVTGMLHKEAEKNGHHMNILLHTNQLSLIREMLRNGTACSCLYEDIIQGEDRIVGIPVVEIPKIRISLIRNKQSGSEARLHRFLNGADEILPSIFSDTSLPQEREKIQYRD